MSYAEEAAAHLKRAAASLDRPSSHAEDRKARLRIAEGYIVLAAVEAGLPPGCPVRVDFGDPDARE
jgi:hypothetical protein